MEFPFITRKKHEEAIRAKNEEFYKSMQSQRLEHEERIHKLCAGLRRILDKTAKVHLSCLKNDHITWRIVLDFDPRPILFGLELGNDEFMIDVIAEELKCKIIKRLQILDTTYPNDLGLEG